MADNWGFILFMAGLATFVLCIIAGAFIESNRDSVEEGRCKQAGGQMVRHACIDKSVIIDLEKS